jgi:hypothetical protein
MPVAATSSTVYATIRPNSSALTRLVMSRLNTRHGARALNVTLEIARTSTPSLRASRKPTPATRKIGRMSSARMMNRTPMGGPRLRRSPALGYEGSARYGSTEYNLSPRW